MTSRLTFGTTVWAIIVAAALGGIASQGELTASLLGRRGKSEVIQMTSESFVPPKLTVKKNRKVCFRNEDTEAHWPASNIHPTHRIYPEFDPKVPVNPSNEWCFTFKLSGIWRYHDHLFPDRTGVVEVKGKTKTRSKK